MEKNLSTTSLKYFSHHHLGVEKEHELFEKQMQSYLHQIQLTYEEEINLFQMIDRIYKAFHAMFDELAIVLNSTKKLELLSN